MSNRNKDEEEVINDAFEQSINFLFNDRQIALNELLKKDYILLYRFRGDFNYCGMNFKEMVQAINAISKKPERNYDYIQAIVERGLVSLIDGSPNDPQIKIICNSNYIRSYIQDEILRKN
jgi:hypothetical protein